MKARNQFFVCPVCFRVCETYEMCHEHQMVGCDVMAPDDERRKPVLNTAGRLLSRAPRWYMEAMGWLPPNEPQAPNQSAG